MNAEMSSPTRQDTAGSPSFRAAPALGPSLNDLVVRMRAGDRDAVAEFVTVFGPLVRRRVRGKLNPGMRRLFDSQEILSTLSRRLDRYVRAGRVEAASEPQLWALVFKMVDAALVDKVRIIRRLRHVEGEDSPFAQTLLTRLDDAGRRGEEDIALQLDAALRLLPSATDRQIVSLWLMGNSHRVIADYVGLSYDATRQRWQSIRERLRAHLEKGQD